MKKDNLFSKPLKSVSGFTFDESVTAVFPDMIQRSVPGYEMIISIIEMFSWKYARPGTNCYDLGCSLGAVTRAMLKNAPHKDVRVIAVDNAPAMIENLKKSIEKSKTVNPVELIVDDVCNIQIINASMVVLNFTLQFIPTGKRSSLISTIYNGLIPGGVLIVSEKVSFDDSGEQNFHFDHHHDFKRYNGYSDLEISQKRTALENILIPETMDTHLHRLTKTGFENPRVWFRCFNFVSFFAMK
ncbi:MAG: carboxy-S-adenosyl-L-methionine synthase CmoA [Fidelibacterota bacterium]